MHANHPASPAEMPKARWVPLEDMSNINTTRQRSQSARDMAEGNSLEPQRAYPTNDEDLALAGSSGQNSFTASAYRRRHAFLDILVIICLLVIFAALENAKPRQVFMVYATLYKHSYPHKPNSVPSWTVPVYSIGAPLVSYIAWKLFERRRMVTWFDGYRVFMATLFAIFLSGAITDALKVAIGRPRPNFVFQCWPDGNPVWKPGNNTYGGYPLCVDFEHVYEYQRSFPSGHSSWSAAGLGFLTYFILGQTHAFSGKARAWAFMLGLVPGLAAIVVGVSRITDYWHNVSDVCVGWGIGFFIAFLTYLSVFPFFTSPLAHVPRYVIAKQVKYKDNTKANINININNHAGSSDLPQLPV